VAQLVNAGCAALSYYTDMLFRSSVLILIASSVLIAGCRAPRSGDEAASHRPMAHGEALKRVATIDSDSDSASAVELESDADMQNVIEAHAHYGAGVLHELNIEPESALEDYYHAALLDPTDYELVISVAQQFLQAKQPDKALELLRNSSTNSGGSSALYAQLGFVYSKMGKTNEAVASDRAAIRKDPRSLAGYQSLYLEYMQNNQTAPVWDLLNDASKVKGTDADFLVGLAEMYVQLRLHVAAEKKGNAETRALAVLQRAAKLKPDDLRVQLRLADGFNLLGKTDEAAKFYEEIVKDLPDTSPQFDRVHAALADIYLQNHDNKRATEQLQAIVRDNPTDSQTYYVLGTIAYEETNYLKAIEYFSNCILFNPDYEPAYYNLATAQLGAELLPSALQTIERERRRFGQSFSVEYISGIVFTAQKDFTNALQHFTTAELLGKNGDTNRLTDGFYFHLAAAYERTGDYAQAEKYFEASLRLSPDSPETLNYLGFMWAEHGMKLDQAREYIAKALKQDPKNAAYLDSMAWVLYQMHQPKPALDYALKALQNTEQEDATLYDHIGDIYNALGQKEKALQAWNKSVSLEANNTVRKKIEAGGK
jgi:tetratricopeptide (TPR) repeat protein